MILYLNINKIIYLVKKLFKYNTLKYKDKRMKKMDQVKELNNLIDKYEKFELRGGAGSGKTKTLLSNIEYSISKNKKILVISFTNVAKDEIIERYGTNNNLEVRTIHSFARNFINSEKELAILTIKNNLAKLMGKKIFDEISNTKNFIVKGFGFSGESHVSYESQNETGIIYIGHKFTLELFYLIFEQDNEMYKKFDDMYDVILIDEFQDTNRNVIKLLSSKKIISTSIGFYGDTMQSIYEKSLTEVEFSSKIETFYKMENYRSSQKLVEFFNELRSDFKQTSKNEDVVGYNSILSIVKTDRNDLELVKELEKKNNIIFGEVMHLTHSQRMIQILNKEENTLFENNRG